MNRNFQNGQDRQNEVELATQKLKSLVGYIKLDQLVDLNRVVKKRFDEITREAGRRFVVGDRVAIEHPEYLAVKGMVLRVNQKTLAVECDDRREVCVLESCLQDPAVTRNWLLGRTNRRCLSCSPNAYEYWARAKSSRCRSA